MNLKLNTNIVLGLVIIICIIIIAVIGISTINMNNEINNTKNKLNNVNNQLEEKIQIISEKNDMLNKSENFFKIYLNGLGSYYSTVDNHSSAQYWYDKALDKYNDGYWSSALGWFWDSSDRYKDTSKKYIQARNLFNNASKSTSNETFISICSIYYDMMNKNAKAISYMVEASDYYAESCDYYLENNYEDAHDSRDNAETKIGFYKEELSKIEDLELELQELLKNII